jgi:protein-S-isoprenylcysteine O-methyltransferase Ste14
MTPQLAINYLWAFWFLTWIVAAFWSSRSAKRPAFGAEVLYRVVTLAGAVLLFAIPIRSYDSPMIVWSFGREANWALFGAAAAGFLFCWWARIHLGRLWSGWVSKKEGHRVIDTGPYAIVRHPIYTGIILAAFATAAIKGALFALVGAAIMTLGFWIKARLEERFLRQELGATRYDAYSRRVPMLVPFGPRAA